MAQTARLSTDPTPGPDGQGSMSYVILIACIATIGGFLFGYDSGVINGTVAGLQTTFHSDSVGTGFNVASMLLGCAAGAFFAGRLADRHGRRFIMRVAAVFFIVSAWGSGIADTSLEFVLYRVLGALSIAAVTVTILLIDRIGRKPILLVGSIGMAVSLALLTYTFTKATTGPSGALTLEGMYGTMALAAANVYVVFFNFSWGPVMWVMLGEMFPNQIRGTGLAVSGLAQWGANFAITMTFPVMLTGIGLAGAYGFYTLCAVLSIWFVVAMVHETRGVELEHMRG
jgi:MFS family permease